MPLSNLSQKTVGNKVFWLLVLFMVVSLVYLNQFTLILREPYVTDAAGTRTGISLPYLKGMPENAEFVITGKIFYIPLLSADKVQIIPDDKVLSIRVNQRDIALGDVNPASLSDFTNGFHFKLSRYLQNGNNEFEIRIRNVSGPAGLYYQNSHYDIRTLIMELLFIFSLGAIIYLILSCFIPNKVAIFIILSGFLLRVLYFLVTPYDARFHDVFDHLDYIKYIVDHWSLPDKYYTRETYSPPLYYISTALIYKIASFVSGNNITIVYRWLQFFSVLLSGGFVVVSFYIFQVLVRSLPIFDHQTAKPIASSENRGIIINQNKLVALMVGLIAFWPSNIVHSARIGNDIMFYFFYALGLLYLIKWYYDNTNRSLYVCFTLISLAMITKGNGIVLLGVAGIVFLVRMIQARSLKKHLVRAVIIAVIAVTGLSITFGYSLWQKVNGSKENVMVGGVEESGKMKDYAYYYYSFDLPGYLKESYMQPWNPIKSRAYFWNYLLKTSVLGEFEFGGLMLGSLAILLGVLLLGMVFFTIGGLIMIVIKEPERHIILLLNTIMLLIAAIFFRISIPATCVNDFRYIVPILIPYSFFYVYTMFICRRKGWAPLEITGGVMAVLFMAASCAFFIGLQF